MTKHFVVFYSPGTFVSEESERSIGSWSVADACEMAHEITERHNATPYAFQFITRERGASDLDSHIAKRSKSYFLGGEIKTLQQVTDENDEHNKVLISNMRSNGWDKVLVNTNSWKITVPFQDGDVLLDWKPKRKRQYDHKRKATNRHR